MEEGRGFLPLKKLINPCL